MKPTSRILAFSILLAVSTASLAQPVITNQPQNQTALVGGTACFGVGAAGLASLRYQWRSYANATRFTNIAGATNAILCFTNVQPTSDRFGTLISDESGSVTSRLATLTVSQPPPTLVSASSLHGTEIGVCFSRVMSVNGLSTPGNYQVLSGGAPVTITSVSLWPGNTSVLLRAAAPLTGEFTVSASQLTDVTLTPIQASSTVTGRVWGASLMTTNVGGASPEAQWLSCAEGQVTVQSWGHAGTAFDYLYLMRTNDFDVCVRVDSAVKNGNDSSVGFDSSFVGGSGLQTLGSLDLPGPFDPYHQWVATPPGGGRPRLLRFAYNRKDVGFIDTYPVWLRVRRTKDQFVSYYATNGLDWVQAEEPLRLAAVPAIMTVGLIAVSESDTYPILTAFSNFGDTPLAAGVSGSVEVVEQPANQTVEVNSSAVLTAAVRGNGVEEGELVYQWQAETLPGSGLFTNVFFATAPKYRTPSLVLGDSGLRLRLAARVTGGSWTFSAPATISVVPDVTPPRVLSVTAQNGGSELVVTFSEAMNTADAVDLFSYQGSNFGVIGATIDESATRVSLMLDTPIDLGTSRELTISGQSDAAGLAIDPNPAVIPVTAPVVNIQRGGARQDLFFATDGTSISSFRGDPRFPGSPELTTIAAQLEGPIDGTEDTGTLISGFLVPPVTGNYNFWMSSDNKGEYWLSTDENPSNLVLLCREPWWYGYRQYNGVAPLDGFAQRDPVAPENRSTTLFPAGIPLVAEQRYYFEALSITGGLYGGLSVAWQIPGASPPGDGGSPIPGAYLGVIADPIDASIHISRQPRNEFSVLVESTDDSGTLLFDQDFARGNGLFTAQRAGNALGLWRYSTADGVWSTDGSDTLPPSYSLLLSPTILVTRPGEVRLSFQHRFSFEDGGFDGGQVRLSVNGGSFTAVPSSAFASNGYPGVITGLSPINTGPAFVNNSPGYTEAKYVTSMASLGVFQPGDRLIVQFLGTWDFNVAGPKPNWAIARIQLTEGSNGPRNATFRVQASASRLDRDLAPLSYLWQRDCGAGFQDILGANEALYTFQPTEADHGCRFRCLLFTPGATATTDVATLTVTLPRLTVRRENTDLTLLWKTGVLQQADTPSGPWSDVALAVSPLLLHDTLSNRFFRLRVSSQ